jgi:hypothetical protein
MEALRRKIQSARGGRLHVILQVGIKSLRYTWEPNSRLPGDQRPATGGDNVTGSTIAIVLVASAEHRGR